MRPHCFEVNQLEFLTNRVSQQIKLSLASELVNVQSSQVALFLVTDQRGIGHSTNCGIYICRNVIVQLFVLAREPTRLDRLEAHAWLRGKNGVASLRGSFIEPKTCTINSTGKSGLSIAARPTPVSYTHLTLPTKRIV